MMKSNNINSKYQLIDKFNIRNVKPNNDMIYHGDIKLISGNKLKVTDNQPKPLAAAVVGPNNTAAPLPNNLDFYHTWTDIDSQEAYLNTKPTCYLILGKPGTGGYTLGESMAKKLNIVHISPKNVIVDEIEQKSPTGNCIDFNLRHNNTCKFDAVIEIMKNKLKSGAVQHRGYVISGLPLVTSSKTVKYFKRRLYTEESVSIAEQLVLDLTTNWYKKKPKEKKGSDTYISSKSSEFMFEFESEHVEEEEEEDSVGVVTAEDVVVLPKFVLEPSCGVVLYKTHYLNSKKAMLLNQCQEMFEFEFKADVIIFITCPDPDAIIKKSRKYFNYLATSNPVGIPQFSVKSESGMSWPNKYLVLETITNPSESAMLNRKYNCRLPINFNSNSTNQLCNYNKYVMPYLEEKIKDSKSRFILKVDGRYTAHEMINVLSGKLLLLPIKPVLIPEPLYLEETSDDINDFWRLAEEMNVIKCGAKRFNRYASQWYNRCPVELKKRHVSQGLGKFAVAFFNHIYLLSSLNAMIEFCRNPRPFLKLQYLEPTCRIIVMGTKSSGKSMMSSCLSWLFDTPVICYNHFLNNEKRRKYENFAQSVLSEIMANIEDKRIADWEVKEQNRITDLNLWFAMTSKALQHYIILSKKNSLNKSEEIDKNVASTEDSFILKELISLRYELSFLPMLEDWVECEQILENDRLLQYAPQELKSENQKPAVPVLGDEDVTKAISEYIVDNDLQKDVEPTIPELMQELMKILQSLNSETQIGSKYELVYGKYIIDGFPSNPEAWDFLFGSISFPDYIIAITENREIDEEIAQHYLNLDLCKKNHDTRLPLVNDDLVKIKLQSKNFPTIQPITAESVVLDLLTAIVESIFTTKIEVLEYLNDSIVKFREEFDILKSNIKDTFKMCIEVQIEDKTDVQILEEVLLNLRKSYCTIGKTGVGEPVEDYGSDESPSNDSLLYNDPRILCETNIYCPVAFYDYGVLWEGKQEFCLKKDNKLHYFMNEEFLNMFQNDVTKYQAYNKPFKTIPALKICVMGSIGSGKTSASKLIAKEYGLIHIDFGEILNCFLLPRHFKKVGRQFENSFTDPPIDEENTLEYNLNEENLNLESELLSNENELRRIIYNYLEKGTSLLSLLMQKILKKLWFQSPFSTTGFVLDGFPKMQSDVEDMIQSFCIPDLIVELECNSEISTQRMAPLMFNNWKTQLREEKIKVRIKLENEKEQWTQFIMKTVVIKLIIEEILNQIAEESIEKQKSASIQSAIIDAHPSGLSNIDVNLFNAYNNTVLEYPEPIDSSQWEKSDDVLEKIVLRIESTYEIEDENIQASKDALADQNIKIISVDGTRPFIKLSRILLSKVASIRHKRETCFEQTFVIDLDVAEMLLLEGFFFLSKFNRLCPVYIFDNPDAIFNPFNISKANNELMPVIHRSHIYFVRNEINLKKFRENPLKYILNDNIKYFIDYPLRIAVIGPPKSGKSELAAKLAKKYGLLCISKGIVLRHILNYQSWTDLAQKLTTKLVNGESAKNDIIIQAVQSIINNYCSTSHGYILDGLPNSPYEAQELQKAGIFPVHIFEINANKAVVLKNSQSEVYAKIIKSKPPYPKKIISNRFLKYSETCESLREYINNDTQNISILDGRQSRWKCFYDANNTIIASFPTIHNYLKNRNTNIVSLAGMCISNRDFEQKMTKFKNMCPVCLRQNVLRHSSYPVDKTGVVQFEERFYWICADHLDIVLKSPAKFLVDNIDIPETPVVVKTINYCNLFENGICVVSYAENLPAQRIERGKEDYAAAYKDKTYLFCSPTCLTKFLAKPHMYYDISIFKESKNFPKLCLKKLPHLGYLEQTVGNIITEACCTVNVLRPKYPGLSIQMSALLHIALYLKIHNTLTKDSYLPLYKKALKTFESRCQLISDVRTRLRSMDNPFCKYPRCCITRDAMKHLDSGTVIKPPSFKTMSMSSFDFNCGDVC